MYPKHYYDLFRDAIDPEMVFVGMSFASSEQFRWQTIIQPAIAGAGLQPYRLDTQVIGGSVLDDILNGIMRAKILVFDVSVDNMRARNGNVMYELGIAHTIRYPEEILILRSDTEPLLFDVSNIRVNNYDRNREQESSEILARMLTNMKENIDSTKSLVLNKIISMLDEVTLGLLRSKAHLKFFSLKELEKAFSPQVIEIRSSIRILLELGILELIFRKRDKTYAYTWTPMGLALLRKLGFTGVFQQESL